MEPLLRLQRPIGSQRLIAAAARGVPLCDVTEKAAFFYSLFNNRSALSLYSSL